MTYQNSSSPFTLPVYKLFKQYSESYSPLLLPKISKYAFGIKASPILISFVAKIKLYDLITVKKQNWIINKVKIKNKLNVQNKQKDKSKSQQKKITLINEHKLCRNSLHNQTVNITQNNYLQKSTILESTPSTHLKLSYHQPIQHTKFQKQPLQTSNWHSILTTYQQLYEFIKIMSRRVNDLQELIDILKQLQIKTQKLQGFHSVMEKHILRASQDMQQLLPADKFRWIIADQDIKKKYFNKNNKSNKILNNDQNKQNNFQKNNFLKNLSKSKNFRIKTQQQIQASQRFTFLKRKTSKNSLTLAQHNLNNLLQKRQSNFKYNARTVQSIIPQKSFQLFSQRDQVMTKNTQERFDDDLQEQHQQIVLKGATLEIQPNFRSQKQVFETLIPKQQNKITTWHKLINQNIRTKPASFIKKPKQRESQQIKIPRQNTDATSSNTKRPSDAHKINNTFTQRVSTRLSPQQSISKLKQSDQKSQLLSSRSSLATSNSHSKQKASLYGIKNKLHRKSTDEMEEQTNGQKKFNNEKGKKRKIRVGAMKKDLISYQDDDSRSVSIIDQKQNGEFFQKGNKNRRMGKTLPQQMNNRFQRIIQDQTIQKIVQANQQRQNQNAQASKINKGGNKQYQSHLKRLKKGTQTSINGGLILSHELAQQYYRTAFRIKKARDSDECKQVQYNTINYGDLLQLQKNLRPISNFNQSKMITRYSTQKAQNQIENFQFRYKNGHIIFNHEFYLRKDEQKRYKDVDQQIQRQKLIKQQYNRIDFMNRFRKCALVYDQPLQIGFDNNNDKNTNNNQVERNIPIINRNVQINNNRKQLSYNYDDDNNFFIKFSNIQKQNK